MAITPGKVAEAVAKAIPAFFNDAIDQLRQGEGGYLRDGMPEGVVARVGQAVGRSACRQYAARGPDAVGSKGERFERACRPYLDTLNPNDDAQFKTPFTGGQCASRYIVAHRIDFNEVAGPVNNASLVGPIGGIAAVEQQTGNNTWNAVIQANGRHSSSVGNCGAITQLGAGGYGGTTRASPPNTRVTAVIVSVTPCNGAEPNNCGNPPPIVVPPVRRPDPTPPPFRFNPIPGIDIPIDVTINTDGTITFNAGDGPTTVDPFPPDAPSGGGGGPDPEADPGSPGSGGDTGAGGDTDGEAGPGEELVGVLVEILATPENPNVFQNNSADVFRGIGYVRMGYPGRLGVDTSASAVLGTQFFHAQQRGLTAWEVRANLGFSLRATPYYRDISE